MLWNVKGVSLVEWNTSKTSQGNASENHKMENNIFVYSDLAPGSTSHPFEFEMTRCQHMKDSRVPVTVTVMFKEPRPDCVPEGWRILCEVVRGRELFPDHVIKYREEVHDRWERRMLKSQQGYGRILPGAVSGSAYVVELSDSEGAGEAEEEKRF